MVSILHISDLHLTQNPHWNIMKRSILSYAEKIFCDIPLGQKLLIVTGDFHNYMQDSYEPAKEFLCELIQAMCVEPTKDVFVVPGNHDISASHSHYDRALVIRAIKEQESYRNALNEECAFRKYAMPKLLSCYNGYLQFVRDMEIYSPSSEELLPVRVHVQTWRKRLHILHLNTTLIADGVTKVNQLTDALTATSDSIQRELRRDNLPCIAIGHNSYMDLDEQLQEQSMKGAFFHGNISAYLCGDQHKTAGKPKDRVIYLNDEASVSIPNIVAPRGSADLNDYYSEFGMILHQWDEPTKEVTYTNYFWKPDDPGSICEGKSRKYKFRDDLFQKSPVTPSPDGKSVTVPVTPPAPSADASSGRNGVSIPVTQPAASVDVLPADKLSPQEKFLADLQSLYESYGFHTSIGRVHFMGKHLIDTLNDPETNFSTKSRSMVDYQKLMRKTITDMENDLEDLHPDKVERIAKLEDLLTDLKAL